MGSIARRAAAALMAAWLCGPAASWAASTVNPNIPTTGAPVQSAPIRNNFAAAATDINNILSKFANPTPPSSPSTYQDWMNTAGCPTGCADTIFDGVSFVTRGVLNKTTHVYSGALNSGNIVATPPLNVAFSGPTATLSLNLGAEFTVSGGNLVFAASQPDALTWAATQMFAVAPVFTDQSGSRTALGLGTAAVQNIGTSGANVPLLSTANTFTLGQTFSAAMTYGGVTLANSVQGTGSMVLATAPTVSSLTVTGAFTATGLVTLADLATQAANTVLVNATSGVASPTAQAAPSCSTAASALNWTTNTGLGCNSSITAAIAPAGALTGAMLAANVLASSLTSVGTLTGGATGAGFTVALTTSTVTGTLPCASHPALTGDVTTSACAATIANNAVTNAKAAQMNAATLKGNPTNALANATDFTIQSLTSRGTPDGTNDKLVIYDNAAGTLKYVTPVQLASAASGTVTSVIIAAGAGISVSGTCTITTSGTCTVKVDQTPITNSLSGDVTLSNTALYFDGPSVAQGASGTWFASGTVTITLNGTATNIYCKLWDGTTTIASDRFFVTGTGNNFSTSMSGYLATPAGNIRISCRDATNTASVISFNATGLSKDSTISAIRVQ